MLGFASPGSLVFFHGPQSWKDRGSIHCHDETPLPTTTDGLSASNTVIPLQVGKKSSRERLDNFFPTFVIALSTLSVRSAILETRRLNVTTPGRMGTAAAPKGSRFGATSFVHVRIFAWCTMAAVHPCAVGRRRSVRRQAYVWKVLIIEKHTNQTTGIADCMSLSLFEKKNRRFMIDSFLAEFESLSVRSSRKRKKLKVIPDVQLLSEVYYQEDQLQSNQGKSLPAVCSLRTRAVNSFRQNGNSISILANSTHSS
uniref:Uncharacterized protein n=1 Tax=Panagrellus redivivus TaxID=6233 RepID=A0A7E4VY46_PANRE